jgi:hypothetical protein
MKSLKKRKRVDESVDEVIRAYVVLLFLVCVPAGKCNTTGRLLYRGSVQIIPYPYPYGYGVGGYGYGVDFPTRGYTRAIP